MRSRWDRMPRTHSGRNESDPLRDGGCRGATGGCPRNVPSESAPLHEGGCRGATGGCISRGDSGADGSAQCSRSMEATGYTPPFTDSTIRSTASGTRTDAVESAIQGSLHGVSVSGSRNTPRPIRRASPWSGSGTGKPGPVTGIVACSGKMPFHAEKGMSAPTRRAAVRTAETNERAKDAGTGAEKNHQRKNPSPERSEVTVAGAPSISAASSIPRGVSGELREISSAATCTAANRQSSPGRSGWPAKAKDLPEGVAPRRCQRTMSSVSGSHEWLRHAEQPCPGLAHKTGRHSFPHAGAQPLRPVRRLVHRRDHTSVRHAKRARKSASLSA